MKIWKNLLEPHIPDIHTFSIHLSKVARFSYLFNLLLRIGQICILFQSPCQNWPDCHTFSIFSKFGRLALVNWAKLKKFQNLILKCLIPSEPERAAEARRAVVASNYQVALCGCCHVEMNLLGQTSQTGVLSLSYTFLGKNSYISVGSSSYTNNHLRSISYTGHCSFNHF